MHTLHEPTALPPEPFALRSSGPHFLKRLTAHVLIRLLIFGVLPAPMQLHALAFPASLFWYLPELQLEPIERVPAPVHAAAQPETRVMGFEQALHLRAEAERIASETCIGGCGGCGYEVASNPGYGYDAEDMLIEALRTQTVIDPNGTPTTSTITAMRAAYDQAGRRSIKMGDDGYQQFVYAGSDLLAVGVQWRCNGLFHARRRARGVVCWPGGLLKCNGRLSGARRG